MDYLARDETSRAGLQVLGFRAAVGDEVTCRCEELGVMLGESSGRREGRWD